MTNTTLMTKDITLAWIDMKGGRAPAIDLEFVDMKGGRAPSRGAPNS